MIVEHLNITADNAIMRNVLHDCQSDISFIMT